jgi:hypothetical protein
VAELKVEDADLNFQLATQRLLNESLMRRIDASAREIFYLRNQAACSRSPTFCLSPLFDAVHVEHDSFGVINGHRLSFVPISHYHLNWGEINYSWASLVKLLRCVRYQHGLPQAVDFALLGGPAAQGRFLGAAAGAAQTAQDTRFAVKHALRLQPLKDRVVLLLEREVTGAGNGASQHRAHSPAPGGPQSPAAHSPTKSVRIHADSSAAAPYTEVVALHLEGGVQAQAGASVLPAGHLSPSPSWSSSSLYGTATAGAMPGAGVPHPHVEYRDAALVVCAAVVVTLLEVHALDTATTNLLSPSRVAVAPGALADQRAGGTAVDAAAFFQVAWWEPLDRLLVGSAQDLALVLLTFSACLEFRTHTAAAPTSPRPVPVPPSPPLQRSSMSLRSPHEKPDYTAEKWAQRLRAVTAQRDAWRRDGRRATAVSLLVAIVGNGSEAADGVVGRLIIDVLRTLERNSYPACDL